MTLPLNIFFQFQNLIIQCRGEHLFWFIYFNVYVALGQQREKIQYEIQAAIFSSLSYKLCDFTFKKKKGQNMYDFDPRICGYPNNLYQLPKCKVLPLFFFRLKELSSVFQLRASKLSSEINGKLCLSERAAISRCSFLLSLHTNEMNWNIQTLDILLHGFEDTYSRSDDAKWNSFSPTATETCI